MQKFFEEYGWTIVAVIIVGIIILMATPLGSMVQAAFTDLITKLTAKFTALIG